MAKVDMRGRDLLAIYPLKREEIETILEVALDLKEKQQRGIPHRYLTGKVLAMIFTKPSTRTRVSFEVGMYQLGGYPMFLSAQDLHLGRGETIADTARVLDKMVDGIMIRTYSQAEVEELAAYSRVPVINGLTDLVHPCQALADLLTIYEYKKRLAGLKVAYVGDGNNVAHSLMNAGAKMGMRVYLATPEGYRPNEELAEIARRDAAASGGEVVITSDPEEAVREADVVYTDVWASMGQEAEREERLKVFAPYQVNGRLVSLAREDYLFLHCLPAHRGEEVTVEVIDGPRSVVFAQAENRLHAQKAVLTLLLAEQEA